MARRTKRLFLLFGALSALSVAAFYARRFGLQNFPVNQARSAPSEEPIIPADIARLMKSGEVHNAVLHNNFQGRLMDPKTKTLKGDLVALGTPANPQDVMIIAEASVPDDMVELYTSITRLPDSAEVVRILYTESGDRKKATLLGYIVERLDGKDIAFVRYDGFTPWLEWVTKSFAPIDVKPESSSSLPKTRQ